MLSVMYQITGKFQGESVCQEQSSAIVSVCTNNGHGGVKFEIGLFHAKLITGADHTVNFAGISRTWMQSHVIQPTCRNMSSINSVLKYQIIQPFL